MALGRKSWSISNRLEASVWAELAGAKPWWLGREVLIVGSANVAELYDRALRTLGVLPRIVPAADAVLAGLSAAHRLIKETA